MEIIIKGDAKEIADLVVAVQGQQSQERLASINGTVISHP